MQASSTLRNERERLLTYTGWPHNFQHPNPRDLARAGFYYTQNEDAVRCAFCRLEISRWQDGDNPMSDHQRWASDCRFIRGLEVGNIPLDPESRIEVGSLPLDMRMSSNISDDRMESRSGIHIQLRPNSVPERCDQNVYVSELGVAYRYRPSYPNYATVEARLRTFKDWPICIRQKSEEVAAAGFFYTGKGDQVLCFSCAGGLKDWLEADDPWEEHARWFTKCSFVLMVKGREFVREVSNRLPAILTAQQGAELQSPLPASPTSSVQQSPSTSNSSEPISVRSSNGGGENSKKLDDGRLCKICYAEELGIVFLPCGHIVVCVKCVQSLSTCSVCRQPFTATVRAFLS